MEALRGDDPAAALAAAQVAMELDGSRDMREALLESARKNKKLKDPVMQQLLAAGAPEGIELARELIHGDDETLGGAAMWSLSRVDTPASRKLMVEGAASTNKETRDIAARMLGSETDPASQKALIALASDDVEGVRHAALQSLAESGTPKAIEQVIGVAVGGEGDDRIAAIKSLGSASSEQARVVLTEAMNDGDDAVATAAIEAVTGAQKTSDALRSILGDQTRSAAIRAAAATKIRELGITIDSYQRDTIDGLLREDS